MNFILVFLLVFGLTACDFPASDPPKSSSGVSKATATVGVQASGMTVEQENIKTRLELENMPGSIKHLYVISSMSGDVILYSTVKGKLTSSGKRLSPYRVQGWGQQNNGTFPIMIDGHKHWTEEVLQDDGTYGSSIPYVYWWDVQGKYHQHYIVGGQIVHMSDQPIAVPKIIINLE